jgi:L-aspartate oxidase
MKTADTDILVLGSGIAGLFYAIKCSAFAKVTVVTKGHIGESNTMYAQGGIAAVFDATDTVAEHFNDTITAGDGLCDRPAVQLLVNEAKQCVLELEKLHVDFNKTQTGQFDLHREGGHSHHRVVHHTDATGREVENALVKIARSTPNISILENHFALDLLVEDGICKGAIVLEPVHNRALLVKAKLTMLATGGSGQVYAHNTNPAIATGDGFAMAFRAGAQMMNMEFVQFHPTVLYAPGKETFLISEAVRGFGAELKHKDGTTFMEHYHPLKSLAPRDIVSRTILHEMAITNQPCVYLDLRPFDKQEAEKHFPNICKRCADEGLDISKDMIPVVPAAHYMCGGVKTDLKARTSISHLYCCGETSCTGVHGANRLASNSLLEGLVFAKQASEEAHLLLSNLPDVESGALNIFSIAATDSDVTVRKNKTALQQIMWDDTGIIRNEIQLEICIDKLGHMKEETERLINKSGVNKERMELLNLIETSLLITRYAMIRTESRGCHFRTDYPEKEPVATDTLIDKWNYEYKAITA